MSNNQVLRLQRELADLQRSPYSQIYTWTTEQNILHHHVLIVGPTDTPYEMGMFDFVLNCGPDYPSRPPNMIAMTTNHGYARLNPNIYADGKVCLSILGTWPGGSTGETWSVIHGINTVLLSVQALFGPTPYRNEPGYETASDKAAIDSYSNKVAHESLRISVLNRIEFYLGIADNLTVYNTSSSSSSQPQQQQQTAVDTVPGSENATLDQLRLSTASAPDPYVKTDVTAPTSAVFANSAATQTVIGTGSRRSSEVPNAILHPDSPRRSSRKRSSTTNRNDIDLDSPAVVRNNGTKNEDDSTRKKRKRRAATKKIITDPSDDVFGDEDGFSTDDEPNKETSVDTTRNETILIEKYADTQKKLRTLYDSAFCVCRPTNPFKDACMRMFVLYHDRYIKLIEKYSRRTTDGEIFEAAKFEVYGNELRGSYQWKTLKERCHAAYKLLDELPTKWVDEYKALDEDKKLEIEAHMKSNISSVELCPELNGLVSIEMADNIPILWNVTFIGPPGSLYADGVFKARISFPLDEEMAPRVKFLTSIFHPQVTKDGYAEPMLRGKDDVLSLVKEVSKLFTDDPSAEQHQHVNLEAAKMYFNEKTRKDYFRKVRRLAQQSVDEI